MSSVEIQNVRNTLSRKFSLMDSIQKLGLISHRPLSVYNRIPWNRPGSITPFGLTAKCGETKPLEVKTNTSSNTSSESVCEFDKNKTVKVFFNDSTGQKTSSGAVDCCDESSHSTSEATRNRNTEKPILDISDSSRYLENNLMELNLGSKSSSETDEHGIDVEDDAETDDEVDLSTINKPFSRPKVLPPIIISLFPDVPPFIRFVKSNEAGVDTDWIGCFGRHISPLLFRQLKDYQKMNHIPGSFELGRKDLLSMNLNKMRTRFGSETYNFYPSSFILPREYSRLKAFCKLSPHSNTSNNNKKRPNSTWIIKPPASARGIGIFLANRLNEIPKRKKLVAQRYISDPFLINGSKFDLRLYVYMSSADPLRLYIHRNGLVRFASQKSLEELWRYLEARNHDTRKIWTDIKAIVFKTIAAAISKMASLVMRHVKHRESVHELFGFDILLDSELRPWLLEVNISPSLHTSTKIDIDIKSEVVVDMLNLAGLRLPPREEKKAYRRTKSSKGTLREFRQMKPTYRPRTSARSPDKQHLPFHRTEQLQYSLTYEEKKKHRQFTTRTQSSMDMKTILDEPTMDDVLMLTTTLNEWHRASLGRFERIYPQFCPESAQMLNLIDMAGGDGLSSKSGLLGTPRYYDALLFQFIQRFGTNEASKNELESEMVYKKTSQKSPSKLGGLNFQILSRVLGISVKGLLFVTKLAEERLSDSLTPQNFMRSTKASQFPSAKSSNPSKSASKSVGRTTSSAGSQPSPLPRITRESPRGYQIRAYKHLIVNQASNRRTSLRALKTSLPTFSFDKDISLSRRVKSSEAKLDRIKNDEFPSRKYNE
ncbi:hypothetical protein Aperf_G00000061556 [Anoplocephala perfoliata]